MEAEIDIVDTCEDCGEPVYDSPDWIVDIVLCKQCYFSRKNSEDEWGIMKKLKVVESKLKLAKLSNAVIGDIVQVRRSDCWKVDGIALYGTLSILSLIFSTCKS